MDRGFGSSNQQIGSTVSSSILAATSAQEEALASQISKYDALLDANDSELELLREKRLSQMKLHQQQQLAWKNAGHGVYMELDAAGQHGGDVAKAFFNATKLSQRVIIHFYRNTTRSCDSFHRALTDLAPKHLETKFIKINVEGCDDTREGGSGVGAKYLVEKLGIVIMPTVLIVIDRKATHHIRGFDELGGTDEFSANELAHVLGMHGALTCREEEELAVPGSGGRGRSGGGGESSGIGGGGGSNSSWGALRSMYCYGGGGGNRGGPRSGGYDDFDDE